MTFNSNLAREIAKRYSMPIEREEGLIDSFGQICQYLFDNPDRHSRKSNVDLLLSDEGLDKLAKQYFYAYRKSDFPSKPGTTPDAMVSIVLQIAFEFTSKEIERIKEEHQLAMSAENCVGALLERYLDSVLRPKGWHWCCGNHVKSVDFIRQDNGVWLMLQIKNRDNSENSSSSAIRTGTTIQKWFRSLSRTGGTNWANLPPLMQGHGLSEEGFVNFARLYLEVEKMG